MKNKIFQAKKIENFLDPENPKGIFWVFKFPEEGKEI